MFVAGDGSICVDTLELLVVEASLARNNSGVLRWSAVVAATSTASVTSARISCGSCGSCVVLTRLVVIAGMRFKWGVRLIESILFRAASSCGVGTAAATT